MFEHFPLHIDIALVAYFDDEKHSVGLSCIKLRAVVLMSVFFRLEASHLDSVTTLRKLAVSLGSPSERKCSFFIHQVEYIDPYSQNCASHRHCHSWLDYWSRIPMEIGTHWYCHDPDFDFPRIHSFGQCCSL